MKALKFFVGIVLAFALLATAGDVSAKKRPLMKQKCQERFVNIDADKDGKVSLQEFKAVKHPRGKAEDLFKESDTDGDGFLSEKEFCSKAGKTRKGMGRGK